VLLARTAALHPEADWIMPEVDGQERPGGVTYTWTRFSEAERRVLSMLSALEGPVDVLAVQRLTGASDLLVGALLHQGHLQGQGVYRVPQLVARLGRQAFETRPAWRRELTRALLAEAQARLTGTAVKVGPAAVSDLRRTTTESILRTLVRFPLGPAVNALLERIADAWLNEGRALAAWELLGPLLDRRGVSVALRVGTARVLQALGDHARAETLLRRTLKHARHGVDRQSALLAYGRVLHRRSKYPQAAQVFRDLVPDLPPHLRAQALHQWARAMLYLGQPDEARAVAGTAVTEAQDTRTEGMARNTLALVLVQLGRMQDARTEFGRADLLLSSVNDTAQVALNLTGLAWTLMLQDEHLQALQHNERLLRLYRDGNARWELANTFLNVGHSHARLGHGAAARSAYGHALSLTAELDAPSLEAEALGGVADLLWREGQPQRASRLYAAAQVHPGHNAEFEMFFAHLRALPCPAHVPTWAEIRAELQQELTPDTPSRPPDHQAVL